MWAYNVIGYNLVKHQNLNMWDFVSSVEGCKLPEMVERYHKLNVETYLSLQNDFLKTYLEMQSDFPEELKEVTLQESSMSMYGENLGDKLHNYHVGLLQEQKT